MLNEIAFFPYKASMRDALESIYLTAKEAPDCDAYCVTIPYYNKMPDGRLGVMHYEVGDYLNYIEITDWQTGKLIMMQNVNVMALLDHFISLT